MTIDTSSARFDTNDLRQEVQAFWEQHEAELTPEQLADGFRFVPSTPVEIAAALQTLAGEVAANTAYTKQLEEIVEGLVYGIGEVAKKAHSVLHATSYCPPECPFAECQS